MIETVRGAGYRLTQQGGVVTQTQARAA